MTSSTWFTLRAIDFAHGNQALYRCKTVAPPTHISRMKLPPTKAILGHRSMTILTGWRWICLTEELRCASCSSSDLKLPPRPNGMPPHSDLSHGLSYKLNPELELFIEQAMEHLSTWKETEGGTVLSNGKDAIQQGEAISTEMELRDRLIDLVSVGNLRHKPEALFALFRQFLKRISLPRLIHFLDLVLPQLMPVQAAWAGEEKTLWSCHYIRYLCGKQYANNTPRVQISYFFTSHDHVHHVRIQWNNHPLLLFSDPQMVEALPVEHFRKQASHVTHQQHLQMGLRKGMAILIYYVVGRTHYQAVLIAEESVWIEEAKMKTACETSHPDCYRVCVASSQHCWVLLQECSLYRVTEHTYHAFDIPHLGLDTTSFVADVFVEDILYLGDTRSADDLAVFTKMAPERLLLRMWFESRWAFCPNCYRGTEKNFSMLHRNSSRLSCTK